MPLGAVEPSPSLVIPFPEGTEILVRPESEVSEERIKHLVLKVLETYPEEKQKVDSFLSMMKMDNSEDKSFVPERGEFPIPDEYLMSHDFTQVRSDRVFYDLFYLSLSNLANG